MELIVSSRVFLREYMQIHGRGMSKKERARKIATWGEYERGKRRDGAREYKKEEDEEEVDATVSLPPDAGSQ